MARRYVDMLPIAEWADALLVFLRVPLANRQPSHVAELGAILRRVMEDQAVEHYTPAELAALARFYATPAGRSIARKSAAFSAAVTAGPNGRGRRVGPDSRRTDRTASLSG